MMEGRFEECERLAKEALAIGERTQDRNAVMFFQLQMTVLRPLQGRYGDVEEVVSKFAEKYPAQPGWRAALAAIHCELGRREKAQREFESLAANDFAAFPRQGDWLVGMAALARVCASLHDFTRAGQLYKLLRPFAKRHVAIGSAAVYFGPVSLYLGALAGTMSNWQDAIQHFEEALQECARLGARPFLARCQFEYGTTLLARSKPEERDRGLALIQSSLKMATELGMKKLIHDARISVSK